MPKHPKDGTNRNRNQKTKIPTTKRKFKVKRKRSLDRPQSSAPKRKDDDEQRIHKCRRDADASLCLCFLFSLRRWRFADANADAELISNYLPRHPFVFHLRRVKETRLLSSSLAWDFPRKDSRLLPRHLSASSSCLVFFPSPGPRLKKRGAWRGWCREDEQLG
ncbi:uncharacterized protein BKA78DRAFT_172698 [Phyllosticta capitalensis]|uniref:uncharacterized protein n=1 Tax=Phyllosticta capitalensis TaxID=121624 RepID=UPI00312EF8DD